MYIVFYLHVFYASCIYLVLNEASRGRLLDPLDWELEMVVSPLYGCWTQFLYKCVLLT